MAQFEGLRQALIQASKVVRAEVGSFWGHISLRLPDGQGLLLKPLRHLLGAKDPDSMLWLDLEGKHLEGEGELPYEIPLYTTLYRARPEVNSIIHTHPPLATAFSVADQPILPIHIQSAIFAPQVPIFPKPDLINAEEIGDELAAALGKGVAILLKGHGAVVVGESLAEACLAIIYLEETARMQLIAATLGKVNPLPLEFALAHSAKVARQRGVKEGWNNYCARHLHDR